MNDKTVRLLESLGATYTFIDRAMAKGLKGAWRASTVAERRNLCALLTGNEPPRSVPLSSVPVPTVEDFKQAIKAGDYVCKYKNQICTCVEESTEMYPWILIRKGR